MATMSYETLRDKIFKLRISLYGIPGDSRFSLEQSLNDVANEKGESSPEYIKLKKLFDSRQNELNNLIAEGEKEFTERKSAEDKAKKEKTAAAQKKKDDLKAQALENEATRARRRNDLETAKIKQEEADALRAPKDASGAPIVTEEGPVDIGDDKYSGYTISKDGVTKPGGETIVFVETKDAQGNIVPQEYNSLAKARKAFLDQYSQPGQLDALKKQLVDSGYLKPAQAKTADWIFGVDDLLIAHTKESIVSVQYGGAKKPKTIDVFLKEKKAGAGGDGGTKTYREYSSRGDATRMLDGYFNDLLGYGATPEEEDAFYKELNAAENKAFRTVTDGRVGVGGYLEDADRLLIAAKIAKKAIKNTDLDLLLKSGQGSQVAMDIADLQTTANEYGIDMPAAEALKYVVNGIGQKDYLLKQQERLRQLSMTMHPYLKEHITAGGTVKDVADQYAKRKAAKLGITITESIKDKDIMNAVATNMSTAAFDIEMQKKPEWRFSSEAKQVADDFANTMLQTWGLG